jgi:hypothetical protein
MVLLWVNNLGFWFGCEYFEVFNQYIYMSSYKQNDRYKFSRIHTKYKENVGTRSVFWSDFGRRFLV